MLGRRDNPGNSPRWIDPTSGGQKDPAVASLKDVRSRIGYVGAVLPGVTMTLVVPPIAPTP